MSFHKLYFKELLLEDQMTWTIGDRSMISTKLIKHRCRLGLLFLVYKPWATSITLSSLSIYHTNTLWGCSIIYSNSCQLSKQTFPRVVESEHWHRRPAREQCPNVSKRSSLLSLCIPTCTAAVQEPRPFLILLYYPPAFWFHSAQAKVLAEVLFNYISRLFF